MDRVSDCNYSSNVLKARETSAVQSDCESLHATLVAEKSVALPLYEHILTYIGNYKKVSINLSVASMLEIFESNGSIKNLHEKLRLDSSLAIGHSFTRQITNRLVAAAAIGLLNEERDLVYGALNTGNGGATLFGPVCLIIKDSVSRSRATFTVRDSLRYVARSLDGGVLDNAIAFDSLHDFCSWTDIHFMATKKLMQQFGGRPDSTLHECWDPHMIDLSVCGYYEYIESQIHGPLSMSDVEEVRIANQELVKLDLLRLKEGNGYGLTEDEATWRNQMQTAIQRLFEWNITITPV